MSARPLKVHLVSPNGLRTYCGESLQLMGRSTKRRANVTCRSCLRAMERKTRVH